MPIVIVCGDVRWAGPLSAHEAEL